VEASEAVSVRANQLVIINKSGYERHATLRQRFVSLCLQ
jgi:hypothetical protein